MHYFWKYSRHGPECWFSKLMMSCVGKCEDLLLLLRWGPNLWDEVRSIVCMLLVHLCSVLEIQGMIVEINVVISSKRSYLGSRFLILTIKYVLWLSSLLFSISHLNKSEIILCFLEMWIFHIWQPFTVLSNPNIHFMLLIKA